MVAWLTSASEKLFINTLVLSVYHNKKGLAYIIIIRPDVHHPKRELVYIIQKEN